VSLIGHVSHMMHVLSVLVSLPHSLTHLPGLLLLSCPALLPAATPCAHSQADWGGGDTRVCVWKRRERVSNGVGARRLVLQPLAIGSVCSRVPSSTQEQSDTSVDLFTEPIYKQGVIS